MLIVVAVSSVAWAKVDLVTLPPRDTVQLTIYNSADMTLVRESRALTLKEGKNTLQFSWANTLIDPTSLEMLPKASADKIDIAELAYPPRVQNLGLWNIESGVSGKVPVEISYLTSGLSWRAFYMGTLRKMKRRCACRATCGLPTTAAKIMRTPRPGLLSARSTSSTRSPSLPARQYPYGRPGEVLMERG